MGLVADPGSGGTVMRQLPKRPNLDQLRRQARELQRRSSPQRLSAAQLALAREYGFRSCARLKAEVQARKGYVSLVSKRRTFAVVQATTKHRVDLGFRLDNQKPAGRLLPGSGLGNGSFSVRLGLASPADLDRDALTWLKRAYDENA